MKPSSSLVGAPKQLASRSSEAAKEVLKLAKISQ